MTSTPLATREPSLGVARGYICFALLVGGVVSWRRKTYFSGGFDPVVVLKAMIIAAALALVLTIPRRIAWERIPVSTFVLLIVYAVETTLGGLASQDVFAAGVLSIRLLLTASVVILLAAKFGGYELFVIMRNVMVGFAIVSIGTGSSGSGRLTGGIPPLSPNELALLCGVSILSITWTCLNGGGNFLYAFTFFVLTAAVYLTGSRTGLALLLVAIFVMIAQARRLPLAAVAASVAVIPAVVYTLGSTGIVNSFVDRGGSGNVTTLSSRTIAWSAALNRTGSFLQQQLGGGLALKQIPVAGQYWNQQTLDSTWISALVQGGNVGIVLCAIWCVVAARTAWRSPRPYRMLWTGLIVFVVGRSFLESGMLDSSAAFLVFFVVSIVSTHRAEASDPTLPAPAEPRTVAAPARLVTARAG